MPTINLAISDLDYNKFGLSSGEISFPQLVDLISKELAKQMLNDSVDLAAKHGFSDMTMDEITNEVKAVRRNAKNHN